MGGSKPQFEKCLFQGNRSYGGVCGISGSVPIFPEGWPSLTMPSTHSAAPFIWPPEARQNLRTVILVDNEAHTRGQLPNTDPNVPNTNVLGAVQATLHDPVVSYGGAVCAEGTAIPVFKNCTFTNNRACAGGGFLSNGWVKVQAKPI